MIELNPKKNVYGPDVPLWERGQHGGRTRPMNRDILFENAKIVTATFDELGIKYCLSHGTILGVHRDGDSIPWDDDCDLAIFAEDRPKLAKARTVLRKRGFYVVDEGNPNKPVDIRSNPPYYDFVAIKDGEKIEGWIFDKIGEYYIYDQVRDGLSIPKHLFDNLSQIKWRDALFYAPSNVEEFLNLMYGSGWKTPDKNRKYNNLRVVDGRLTEC